MIIGFIVTIYFSITNIYVPVNQEVVTAANDDIFVVVRKESNIAIPISNFFSQKYTKMYVDIYFKDPNLRKSNFVSPPLLTSNSSSLLSQADSKFEDKERFTRYDLTMRVGHPLYVGNSTGIYDLKILYRPGNIEEFALHNSSALSGMSDNNMPANISILENATASLLSADIPQTLLGNIKVLSIPLKYQITTLDFSRPEYFWIIALGVLASRVFTISKDSLNEASLNLGVGELIWVPFSAIITLLIFSSFVNQITLTKDIFLNLALAFGFGFGFDKVFEAWQKSPSQNRPNPQSSFE